MKIEQEKNKWYRLMKKEVERKRQNIVLYDRFVI